MRIEKPCNNIVRNINGIQTPADANLYEVSRKAEPDKLQVFRAWPI